MNSAALPYLSSNPAHPRALFGMASTSPKSTEAAVKQTAKSVEQQSRKVAETAQDGVYFDFFWSDDRMM